VGELPAFNVQLARLAGLHGLDAADLARRGDTDEAAIRSVLAGAEPGPMLLRRLASALGLHRSDLFVIAGQPVPADLAPLDPKAATITDGLAWDLTYLPGAAPELRQLIASLPSPPPPPGPPPVLPLPYRNYPDIAGSLVVRLLHNRNLTWLGCATFLFGIGWGDGLSASTIGLIARGRKALTPDLLAGLAAVIDIPAADLSALTGVGPVDPGRAAHPDTADVAALLWDARRLSAAQLETVADRAHDIRHERAAELEPGLRCTCPRSAAEG
jgi:transcriptional regulator with XRE-family HTH domain